jgi:hypothetical protein
MEVVKNSSIFREFSGIWKVNDAALTPLPLKYEVDFPEGP